MNKSSSMKSIKVVVSSSMEVLVVHGVAGSRGEPLGTPWTMVEGGAT